MSTEIIVTNGKRVSDIIGVDIEEDTDLLKANNEQIKKFINKYNNLIYSTDMNDIKDFFEETRIIYYTFYRS